MKQTLRDMVCISRSLFEW